MTMTTLIRFGCTASVLPVLCVMTVCHPVASAADRPARTPDDERSIEDPQNQSGVAMMLGRADRAFNEKDLETMLSCIAQEHVVFVSPAEKGDELRVRDRGRLEEFLRAGMAHPGLEGAELIYVNGCPS